MSILDHLPIIGRRRRIHARLEAYCTPSYLERIAPHAPLYGTPRLPTRAELTPCEQPYDRLHVSDVMPEINTQPTVQDLRDWALGREQLKDHAWKGDEW